MLVIHDDSQELTRFIHCQSSVPFIHPGTSFIPWEFSAIGNLETFLNHFHLLLYLQHLLAATNGSLFDGTCAKSVMECFLCFKRIGTVCVGHFELSENENDE